MDGTNWLKEAVEADGSCPEETLVKLRDMPLLQLCKDMQPLLTEETTVAHAMRTLARAAVKRQRSLQDAELRLLGTFFAQKAATPRFSDAAATCLKTVVDDLAAQGNHATALFEIVVDHFLPAAQVQNRNVGVRRTCFSLVQSTATREVLADAAVATSKRLRAVLESIDGEGDPLLVVATFSIANDILTWGPPAAVKEVSEDFFEALASYFPVLFTQPPGCPVTKKDLQTGLARCLSHPALAEFCIPFLLGKVVSPSTVVKLDVVQTIHQCIERYPSSLVLSKHAGDIVSQLRNEVLKMSAFPDQGNESGPSPTTATPANVISTSCSALTKIAQLCDQYDGDTSGSEVLQVFAPINEGIVHAVSGDAARHTCSAYATMLFSTMVGSWPVCLASGGYVFTMMTLVAADEEGKPRSKHVNTLIAFSALCAGFVDAVDAGGEVEEEGNTERKLQMRTKLANVLPAFIKLLRSTCAALSTAEAGPEAVTERAEQGDKELLTLCQAELVCSALKLDLCLAPWLPEADADQMVNSLVRAGVLGATSTVRTRVGRLLCGFVSMDPDNRVQQAVQSAMSQGSFASAPLPSGEATAANSDADRLQKEEEKRAESFVDLLEMLSAASLDFARFALHEILLSSPSSTEAPPLAAVLPGLTSAKKARAVVNVLDNFTSLDDAMAEALLDKLLAHPQDPAGFEGVCAVFSKATDEFRAAAFSRDGRFGSALVKAALLSCGPDLLPEQARSPEARASLLSLFSDVLVAHPFAPDVQGNDALWREVAMNGITGALVCSSTAEGKDGDVTFGANPSCSGEDETRAASIAFTVATLWGRCLSQPRDALRGCSEMSKGNEPRHVDAAAQSDGIDTESLFRDAAAQTLTGLLVTATVDERAEAETLSALCYFPVLATTATASARSGSLLSPYLSASTSAVKMAMAGEADRHLSSLPVYWKGLLSLLAKEDVRHIRACEAGLLRLLSSVGMHGHEEVKELVRAVFFLLDKKGVASFLFQTVISHIELLRVVCGGLVSPSMEARRATLTYLSSVAETAAGKGKPGTHTPNPVQRRLCQDARDVVLRETLPILLDKKRLVRQAAGRCRNNWFKVK